MNGAAASVSIIGGTECLRGDARSDHGNVQERRPEEFGQKSAPE
jgi:hypothetical protein